MQIVPTLGCSLEMLDIVCQAVDAVLDRDDPAYLSAEHLKTIRSLEIRTQSLEQRATGISDADPEEMEDATNVAEIYRLATLVYLCRVARGEPRDSNTARELIQQSFELLGNMKFCGRPWPLFVIALEAHTEELRKIALTALEESLRRRPFGSMALAGRMIREAWVPQGLRALEMDSCMV